MPTRNWLSLDEFQRELPRADRGHLEEMRDWAARREVEADRPGMGRSRKARRMFHLMRLAVEEAIESQGVEYCGSQCGPSVRRKQIAGGVNVGRGRADDVSLGSLLVGPRQCGCIRRRGGLCASFELLRHV